MKKHLIIFLIASLVASSSFGQNDSILNNTTILKDYLKKSRDQKTAGFVCLGITGVIIAIAAPGKINFDALPTVAALGLVAGIGSITLFIASGKNKRKANLSLTQQKTTAGFPFTYKAIQSLTLKISFTKLTNTGTAENL